jgi:hypothetical protein
MECYYGDAFLCKVEKKDIQDFDKLPSFVVSSICGDAGIVDMFFDEYLPDFEVFVSTPYFVFFFICYCFYVIDECIVKYAGASAKLFSGALSEVPALLHSECGSKDVVSGDIPLLASPPSVNGKVGVGSFFPRCFTFY